MEKKDPLIPSSPWRAKLHEVIFEADTLEGKLFDVVLLWAILLSVVAVMLESVSSFEAQWGFYLRTFEWIVTILFTIEYALRIICITKPSRYIFSFFGIIDLLAVIPTYLALFVSQAQYFLLIRVFRLLRIFRILKLARYLSEAQLLMSALRASKAKVIVFLGAVFSLVVMIGAVMYLIEGPAAGYTSIPKSMYWAIVTLTTVGYGDITPTTPLGQALSACVMVLGYGIIAVPTGIVSAELSKAHMSTFKEHLISAQACRSCGRSGHTTDAKFCKYCGENM